MCNEHQSSLGKGLKEKKAGGAYRRANIALALSALGLAAAYPFHGTFWGGLLTSGCSAALVGGLADWFAVNALFRRPLGIPAGRVFRTEIIPRNRERIIQALRSMVENELLSREALKTKVASYDFAAAAAAIWQTLDRDALQTLFSRCGQLLGQAMENNPEELRQEILALLTRKNGREEQLRPWAAKALHNLGNSREGLQVIGALLDNLSRWVEESEFQIWLTHWLEKSRERYISQNPARKMLVLFLPEPARLAHSLQKQAAGYLREEQTKREVREWLLERLKDGVEAKPGAKGEIIYAQLLETLLAGLLSKLPNPANISALSGRLLQTLDEGVFSLRESPEKRRAFNQFSQSLLLPFLADKPEKIGELVQEGLEKYSQEMLVELIEAKAGADLQMIRINGSVVGGLAGMVIYLLSQVLFAIQKVS